MTTKLSSETAPQQTLLEQAARQALSTDEALMALELILRDGIEHGNWPLNKNCEDGLEAITALRKTLAKQAEQEPVATVKRNEDDSLTFTPLRDFYVVNGMELYAAPVRTKDLTDDEIHKCMNGNFYNALDFARAVIAADREKNNANNNS